MAGRGRALVAGALLLAACRAAVNYVSPSGPRYAEPPAVPAGPGPVDSIRIVTFNVQFAIRVRQAAHVLDSVPELHGADIVLLQEMDPPGAAAIAHGLGLGYVYYPATLYPGTGRDFGNAVLSRWPIVADEKIVLPHAGRMVHTERAAVAATVLVGGTGGVPVRVYSLHLGTPGDVGPGGRRDQIRAVLDDAARYPIVILGGDFNSSRVPDQALARGFLWPTRHGLRTSALGRIDHILVRGLDPAPGRSTGTAWNGDASDHLPVWLVVRLPATPAPTDTVR